MSVEINYAIAIATLIDWLKSEKQKQNQSHLLNVIFLALWASYNIVYCLEFCLFEPNSCSCYFWSG